MTEQPRVEDQTNTAAKRDEMTDAGSGPPRRSRARSLAAGLVVLALVAAGAAYRYWAGSGTTGGAQAEASAASAPAVTVSHPLELEIVEWDEYTGQFSAVEYVEIRARVTGYLTEIHFADGQFVRKGDLLFVIDPRPFEADLNQAEANLERDKAQVVRANLDLARYAELAKKSIAPKQQVEQARATADGAIATVKADEASVMQAKLNLEFTHMTAPVSGRIGSHQVSLGNLVMGGSTGTTTLLTTIVSLDPIYFNFDMSETDYLAYQRAVAAGKLKSTRDTTQPVQAKLVDEHTWTHEGHMDFVDNQINRGSGTIRARAVFANPDLIITPGQFGRARVPGSEPYRAVLIPDSAVVTDQSRKIVMTVKEDGTVEARAIRPGPSYQGLRIVRSGLSANDTIIINGIMRARAGGKVTPQQGQIELDPQAD